MGEVERTEPLVLRGELVVDEQGPNGAGWYQRDARYPSRRDFLRRVEVGGATCFLEWFCPSRLQLALGEQVLLRVWVDREPAEIVFGEVVRVRDEFPAAGVMIVLRMRGEGRELLGAVVARMAGRLPEQLFRDGVRVPVALGARYPGGKGTVRDLSRWGAGLVVHGRIPEVGSLLELRLRTGLARTDRVLARARWVSPRPGGAQVGVQFVEASPAAQRRLLRRL